MAEEPMEQVKDAVDEGREKISGNSSGGAVKRLIVPYSSCGSHTLQGEPMPT